MLNKLTRNSVLVQTSNKYLSNGTNRNLSIYGLTKKDTSCNDDRHNRNIHTLTSTANPTIPITNAAHSTNKLNAFTRNIYDSRVQVRHNLIISM